MAIRVSFPMKSMVDLSIVLWLRLREGIPNKTKPLNMGMHQFFLPFLHPLGDYQGELITKHHQSSARIINTSQS